MAAGFKIECARPSYLQHAMSKVNRFLRRGLVAELETHNTEVTTCKHHLIENLISSVANIVLGYTFAVPGLIDLEFVDRFTSPKWPEINMGWHYIQPGFNTEHNAYEEILFVRNYNNRESISSVSLLKMWDAIVDKRIDIHMLISINAVEWLSGFQKLCADMLDGYVHPI